MDNKPRLARSKFSFRPMHMKTGNIRYYSTTRTLYNNNVSKNRIPVVSYFNAGTDKSIVHKENKNKSGIYR